MAPEGQVPSEYFALPTLVFGPREVMHLQRELESLDLYIEQVNIRDKGKQPMLPKTSRLLDDLASGNNMNLLVAGDRTKLAGFLKDIEHKAPTLHISFASDPSSLFMSKIVAWLRNNIHPYTLVRLGMQPNVIAGCVLRTNNKWFDLSLRNSFKQQSHLLDEAIAGGVANNE